MNSFKDVVVSEVDMAACIRILTQCMADTGMEHMAATECTPAMDMAVMVEPVARWDVVDREGVEAGDAAGLTKQDHVEYRNTEKYLSYVIVERDIIV